MTTPAPRPAEYETAIEAILDRLDSLEDRVAALEDRVGELLGVVTDTQPDVYEARRTLNTANKHDRPQALADLDRAVHLRATVEDIRTGSAVVPDEDQAITLLTDLADALEDQPAQREDTP